MLSGYKHKSLRDSKMPLILAGAGIIAVIVFGIILFTNENQAEDQEKIAMENRIRELENRTSQLNQLHESFNSLEVRLKKLENSIPLITAQIERQLDQFQRSSRQSRPPAPEEPKRTEPVKTVTVEPKAPETVKPVPKTEETRQPVLHKVAHGETLFQISRRYGTTVDEIMKLNNMTSSAIAPDQLLRVR